MVLSCSSFLRCIYEKFDLLFNVILFIIWAFRQVRAFKKENWVNQIKTIIQHIFKLTEQILIKESDRKNYFNKPSYGTKRSKHE